MRIAFLADIHGNLPALEAVVADLAVQSPDAVYLVGDQINRCPWSNEVLDLVGDKGWPAIYGNHELVIRMLATPHEPNRFDDRVRFPDLWWTLVRLGPQRLATIQQLPAERQLQFDSAPSVHIMHGVPGDPFRGFFLSTEAAEMAAELENIREQVIICGHTHQPLHRKVGKKLVLNGGSVGISYTGDPRAHYLLLSQSGANWTPIFRRVEYPIAEVSAAFDYYELDEAFGPLTSMFLRTVETAQPWTSDFGHWLNSQSIDLYRDLERAVAVYERDHGPGQWSFLQEQISD